MIMAVYSHYMVNDKFERIAPALVNDNFEINEKAIFEDYYYYYYKKWSLQVFFFMLTGRLVIDWQLRRQEAQSVTANGVDDKSKKQDWTRNTYF